MASAVGPLLLKNAARMVISPDKTFMNDSAYQGKTIDGYFTVIDPRMSLRDSRLDFEKNRDTWLERKHVLNEKRRVAHERFDRLSLLNRTAEYASSLPPIYRDRKEILSSFAVYQRWPTDINKLPVKTLKQVLTPLIVSKDREAIEHLQRVFEDEKQWKLKYKAFSHHRREMFLKKREQRSAFNDYVTSVAKQVPRPNMGNTVDPNNCSERLKTLSQPKKQHFNKRDLDQLEFRGFVNADLQPAISALRASRTKSEDPRTRFAESQLKTETAEALKRVQSETSFFGTRGHDAPRGVTSSSKDHLCKVGASSTRIGWYDGCINSGIVCKSLDGWEADKELYLLATGYGKALKKSKKGSSSGLNPRRLMIGNGGNADHIALPRRVTIPKAIPGLPAELERTRSERLLRSTRLL